MKNIFVFIFCFAFISLHAQDYYYNGNNKVKINHSANSFISFDTLNQKTIKGFNKIKAFSKKGFTILEEKKVDSSTDEFIKQSNNQIISAITLETNGKFKMFPTKTIRIKLNKGIDKNEIVKLFHKGHIVKIENKYDVLSIEIKDIHKSLETANKIFESGLVEFSIPDFYIPLKLNTINDPLFPFQYQMHNTGQTIDGIAGVNNIDCNAFEAWDISLGDNITVAVIDEGLENHEDLENRLIGGYTPASNGNGTPLSNSATHGMACAGVIGAGDNNVGIRGAAPNVKLLSVNIFADGTTAGDIADGIKWAIDNGADVLSNSWSIKDVPCNYSNPDIDNAIQNAVTKGRNRKGAIVVFASGNKGGCVEYPASNPNVIAVGAIDNRGNLYSYSARGPQLDLVAPSGYRFGDVGVRTLDRMNSAGDNSGNYKYDFDGTSAACPLVSGIAALVLSVNPNLTQQEVRGILTTTATDMGTIGFDNNFGFGKPNAFNAVILAIGNITGSSTICTSNTVCALNSLPPNSTITWSNSPNITIVSGQGTNSLTIKATNRFFSGSGYIKATLSSFGSDPISIEKNVWVGKPKIDGYISGSSSINCPGTTHIFSFYGDVKGESSTNWAISGHFDDVSNSNNYDVYIKSTNIGEGYVTFVASNVCGEDIFCKSVSVTGSCYPGLQLLPSKYSCDLGLTLPLTLNVSPNPSSDRITISLKDQELEETRANNLINIDDEKEMLTITNSIGFIVIQQQYCDDNLSLDISNLSKGIYTATIIKGDKKYSTKFIKQ